MKIIIEIGLNHMGSSMMAKEMASHLCDLDIYGITLQIREREYYQKKPYLALPDSVYKEISELCEKNSVKFGLSVCEEDAVLKHAQHCSFWKILSWKLEDSEIVKACVATGKPTHMSTGKHNTEDVVKLAKKYIDIFGLGDITIIRCLNLIHTTLDPEPTKTDLSRISMLRNQTGLNVGFGLHSHHKEALYLALSQNPDSIFFYVKNDTVIRYPDNKNAISIEEVTEAKYKVSKIS